MITADSGMVEQVIVNLAVNARDAMPGGGQIFIETEDVWRPMLTPLGSVTIGQYVDIRIRDTGMGMDEETRLHAFEPFYTTKKKGSGLGLMIVQRIVRAHGGRIELESQVGRGTTFRIWLPLHERKPRLLEAPMHD